ncbi:MAG: hypothetical protein HQK50_00080 [Oligoflexia bacterium]|nr:hypothetical protein [Oligoflexia bacterium]
MKNSIIPILTIWVFLFPNSAFPFDFEKRFQEILKEITFARLQGRYSGNISTDGTLLPLIQFKTVDDDKFDDILYELTEDNLSTNLSQESNDYLREYIKSNPDLIKDVQKIEESELIEAYNLSKEITQSFNKTIHPSNENYQKIAEVISRYAAVIRGANPEKFSSVSLENFFTDEIKSKGLNDALVKPMLNDIDNSFILGKKESCKIINPLLSVINPQIGNILSKKLGLPMVFDNKTEKMFIERAAFIEKHVTNATFDTAITSKIEQSLVQFSSNNNTIRKKHRFVLVDNSTMDRIGSKQPVVKNYQQTSEGVKKFITIGTNPFIISKIPGIGLVVEPLEVGPLSGINKFDDRMLGTPPQNRFFDRMVENDTKEPSLVFPRDPQLERNFGEATDWNTDIKCAGACVASLATAVFTRNTPLSVFVAYSLSDSCQEVMLSRVEASMKAHYEQKETEKIHNAEINAEKNYANSDARTKREINTKTQEDTAMQLEKEARYKAEKEAQAKSNENMKKLNENIKKEEEDIAKKQKEQEEQVRNSTTEKDNEKSNPDKEDEEEEKEKIKKKDEEITSFNPNFYIDNMEAKKQEQERLHLESIIRWDGLINYRPGIESCDPFNNEPKSPDDKSNPAIDRKDPFYPVTEFVNAQTDLDRILDLEREREGLINYRPTILGTTRTNGINSLSLDAIFRK